MESRNITFIYQGNADVYQEYQVPRRSAFRMYQPAAPYSSFQLMPNYEKNRSMSSSTHNSDHAMAWSNGQSFRPLQVPNVEQQQSSFTQAYADFRNGHLQSYERSMYAEKPKEGRKKKTDAIQCTVCKKMFVSITTLKVHMRIHLGQKPYKCPHCNKAFAQSGNLVSHIRIHTGERPFLCDVCGKRFTQSSSLKTHLKMHKRQEEEHQNLSY